MSDNAVLGPRVLDWGVEATRGPTVGLHCCVRSIPPIRRVWRKPVCRNRTLKPGVELQPPFLTGRNRAGRRSQGSGGWCDAQVGRLRRVQSYGNRGANSLRVIGCDGASAEGTTGSGGGFEYGDRFVPTPDGIGSGHGHVSCGYGPYHRSELEGSPPVTEGAKPSLTWRRHGPLICVNAPVTP